MKINQTHKLKEMREIFCTFLSLFCKQTFTTIKDQQDHVKDTIVFPLEHSTS